MAWCEWTHLLGCANYQGIISYFKFLCFQKPLLSFKLISEAQRTATWALFIIGPRSLSSALSHWAQPSAQHQFQLKADLSMNPVLGSLVLLPRGRAWLSECDIHQEDIWITCDVESAYLAGTGSLNEQEVRLSKARRDNTFAACWSPTTDTRFNSSVAVSNKPRMASHEAEAACCKAVSWLSKLAREKGLGIR